MNGRSSAGRVLLAAVPLIVLLSPAWPIAAASGAGSIFAPARSLPPAGQADAALPVVTGALSLEDALKLALQYSVPLRRAREDQEIARGRQKEAWSEALPKVSVAGQYDRLDQEFTVDFDGPGGEGPVNFTYLDNYSVGLLVEQPLFRAGRAVAAIRAAQYYDMFTDETLRLAVQETLFAATQSYYYAMLAREQVRVLEASLQLAEAQFKDTETKKKFGVASEFNVLRAEVEVSNAKAQLIRAKNDLDFAWSDLFRVLGVSQNSSVELTQKLERDSAIPEFEASRETAFENRPEISAAALSVKLQEQKLKALRSDYWPTFDAFYSLRYAKPDPVNTFVYDWGSTWSAGILMRWNVFDGMRREGILVQEKARQRQYELDWLDTVERTTQEVRKATDAIENALEALRAQDKTMAQAQEGLRLAEVGFREGTLDQVAVLDARTALTSAQLLYFRSLYDYYVAKLALARVTGTLGPKAGEPVQLPTPPPTPLAPTAPAGTIER
jgi:outer membrane protein TolC